MVGQHLIAWGLTNLRCDVLSHCQKWSLVLLSYINQIMSLWLVTATPHVVLISCDIVEVTSPGCCKPGWGGMEMLGCPDINTSLSALLVGTKGKGEPIQFGASAAAGAAGR